MDLNALSKLTLVSENKNESKSNNADPQEGFEATFLEDKFDERVSGHLLDNSFPASDSPEKPAIGDSTSGSGSNDDSLKAKAASSEASAETAQERTSGSGPSDGRTDTPFALAGGPPDDVVTKPDGAQERVDGTRQMRGNVSTAVGHSEIGPQPKTGMSQMSATTEVGSTSLDNALSKVGALSTSELATVAATVGKVNPEDQVKGKTDANSQFLGGNVMGQPQTKAGDLNTNQLQAQKPNAAASLTLLERHLGGYSVRLLSESRHGETTTREIKASGPDQFDGLILAKVVSTAAQQQSGLIDQKKAQPLQNQMATHPNADMLTSAVQGDIPQEAAWDVRPVTHPVSITAGASMTARPELATSVSHQMAEAMRVALDRSVEIALNPAELGRVRMVLSPTEAGVTLNILAERPETLDLMRRNIDDLAKSFAELGYEDISFSFEQNDQMSDESPDQPGDAHTHMTIESDTPGTPTIPVISRPQLAIVPDGVDMRL